MATFRKLKSGNWQARVYRNGKYETIGTFRTKKEAEIKAAEAERAIYYNQTIIDRNMKFQEVIDDWFELKSRTVKESTLQQLEALKRNHIEKYFGNMKLYQITRKDIKDWIMMYEKTNFTYGSRLKFLATLKDIFNHAVYEMEVLDKNPAAKLQIPVRGNVSIKDDVKYYTLTELDTLLNYLKEYNPPRYPEYKPYYVLIYFLSRTGLRISEALAIRWGDIEGNKVTIDKQTSRDYNNNVTITTLKTYSSYRVIEIDEETVELLAWFRKVQQKMMMKYKQFKRNKDLIVFQTYNGNYMTPSTIRETLKEYCLSARVEYKGTHAFRHTHAVLSLEAGADLVYISKRLGHGSIQTTADTYLDITNQYETNQLNKISSYLNKNRHDMAQSWHDGHIQ